MKIEQIFKNNNRWIAKKLAVRKDYFENLAKGQSPELLYIGCSDSRVPAEDMMGTDHGEVFVHRNIANMVVNTDLNVISVVNYAVNNLKVNHIIICGHYYCGGIQAAMEDSDFGKLNPWLREIKDVYRFHQQELNNIKNSEDKYKRLVELNVLEQCKNIVKISAVQKAFHERSIQLHGWVFDIKSGKLIDQSINFNQILDGMMDIYKLK